MIVCVRFTFDLTQSDGAEHYVISYLYLTLPSVLLLLVILCYAYIEWCIRQESVFFGILFNDTIEFNLKYGNQDATQEDLERVAK